MQRHQWIIGPAAIALALGAMGLNVSQADEAPKGDVPKSEGLKGDRPKMEKPGRGAEQRIPEDIEKLAGKPLTEEQKTQLLQAMKERNDALKAINEKFNQSVAGVLGLTVQDMEARRKALRKQDMEANHDNPRKGLPGAEGKETKEGAPKDKPATPKEGDKGER